MKQPLLIDYLLGNLVSLLGLGIGSLMLGYGIVKDAVAVEPLMLCGFFFLLACKSRMRLTHYWEWKREWRAINGIVEPSRRPLRNPRLRFVLGVTVWVAFGWFASARVDDPNMHIVLGLYWFILAVVVLFAIGKTLRHRRKRPSPPIYVALCIGKPLHSPAVANAYATLPNYCHALTAA